MKAELKYLHSPDIGNLSLENYSPENPDNFSLFIQAMIGPLGEEGEESFNFLVCTPKRLTSELEDNGFLFGKAYLFVREYNYKVIHKTIKDLCDRIYGDNWNVIAQKLSRFGHWEFEDYQEPSL